MSLLQKGCKREEWVSIYLAKRRLLVTLKSNFSEDNGQKTKYTRRENRYSKV